MGLGWYMVRGGNSSNVFGGCGRLCFAGRWDVFGTHHHPAWLGKTSLLGFVEADEYDTPDVARRL